VTRSLSLAIVVRLRPTFPDDAGSSGLGSRRQDRQRLSLLCPTSSNAGCLTEPLSSDVSVGLGKLGRVLERLVHLMSKTGAVEKTDQAEVGREGPPNLHYQRRFHDHRAKRRRKPGVKAPEEFALHRRQIWHLVTHPLLDAVVSPPGNGTQESDHRQDGEATNDAQGSDAAIS
jgi:hypothetical protein